MKREERLHRLLGGIDEGLVEDADRADHPVLRLWLPRIAAVAAAAVLTIGIATGPWWQQSPPPIAGNPGGESTDTTKETGGDVSADAPDVSNETGDNTDKAPESDSTTGTSKPVITTSKKDTYTTKKATTVTKSGQKTTATVTKTTIKKGNTTKRNSTTVNLTTTTCIIPTTWKPTATKTIAKDTTTTRQGGETKYIPRWDEKSIVEKYSTFKWNNTVFAYGVREKPLPVNYVDAFITDITVSGYDVYTDTTHTETAHLYAIKSINPQAAVAIRYGDDPVYYPANNPDYTPATLGDLIRDLNLEEYLQVNSVYFEYRDADNNFHHTTYSGLSKDTLWQMLLSDTTLPNVYDQQMGFFDTIDVSVSIPLLDITHAISVDESGYLYTNLLSTGKAFYAGKDVYTSFVTYVQKNCTVESDRVVVAKPTTEPDDTTGTTTSKRAHPITGATTKYD